MPHDRRCPWPILLLAALFAIVAAGCKMSPSSASPGYYDGGGEGYAEQDYYRYSYDDEDYGGEVYEEAPAPPPAPEPTVTRAEAKKMRGKSANRGSRETAATGGMDYAPDEPEPVDTATKPPEVEPVDGSEAPDPGDGRQIIYTAGMGVSVFDVDAAMAKLEAIPERHGGWLHARYDNSVILRVPAEKLEQVMAEVAEYGVVEWKTLEALDVTAEYTDLESRIRVLEQMQGHLEALLARAENVEQALEIQMELSRITAELEQLRAQMRLLASAISFSTLAVELWERGPTTVEPGDDPFPWVDELGAEATGYR